MKRIAFLAALFTCVAGAASYFPLAPGNQWIYRGPSALYVVEAAGTRVIDGQTYTLLKGLPGGDVWLRESTDGKLLAYDEAERAEKLWVDFAAPLGESRATAVERCTKTAAIQSRDAVYQGPIGRIEHAVEIMYMPQCADAGLLGDVYGPGIGLLRRTMTSFAGPRAIDLVYARVGGNTVLRAAEESFTLALDQNVYPADPGTVPRNRWPLASPDSQTAAVRLTLYHSGAEPLRLEFPTAQLFDFALRNAAGDEVFRWSAGKVFAPAVQVIEIPAGEKNWAFLVPLTTSGGQPLPAGHYVAEAWLTATGAQYSATQPLEIRQAGVAAAAQ